VCVCVCVCGACMRACMCVCGACMCVGGACVCVCVCGCMVHVCRACNLFYKSKSIFFDYEKSPIDFSG
jgi:hypothetical protein